MENLNAEQVKKVLECCGASDKSCSSCPLAKDYSPCSKTMADNALALIKSQEQKIEAYRQELAEVRVALAEANCDKKRLTEEAECLKQCMEHEHASFMETFGEYGEKCDKLTEENDKLRASCTELAQECKKWQGRLKIECEYTKADTVRKVQERIKEYFPYDADSGLYVVLDQIAKEMEGEP